MSKGSILRPRSKKISEHEEDLRWEYLKASKRRKLEILEELDQIKKIQG